MPQQEQSNNHNEKGLSVATARDGSVDGSFLRVTGPGVQQHSFEKLAIQCFVEVALAFSLPRSLGEIFGLLFASPNPIPFETVLQRLKLSKASVSTGLKYLQRMGLVHTVYVTGDRRTFYKAEECFENAVQGLLTETILPRLKAAHMHMADLIDYSEKNPDEWEAALESRVSLLAKWQKKLSIDDIPIRTGSDLLKLQ